MVVLLPLEVQRRQAQTYAVRDAQGLELQQVQRGDEVLATEHRPPENLVALFAHMLPQPLVSRDALVLVVVLLPLEIQCRQAQTYAVRDAQGLELQQVQRGHEVVYLAVVQSANGRVYPANLMPQANFIH